MEKSIVYLKSFELAKRIITVYKGLLNKNEHVMSWQLLRCGTSVGANIAEAISASSKKDFSAKMSIAYKEINECLYWIKLLFETGYIDTEDKNNVEPLAIEVSKMLCAIVRTTRDFKN